MLFTRIVRSNIFNAQKFLKVHTTTTSDAMQTLDFSTLLQELLTEPVKITLWWIILRHPGITAKELKNKANLEGNSIYYYLSQLEKLQLIDTTSEALPNSNLSRKRYSISKTFIESRQTGILAQELRGQDKEILLFELLLMNSIVYHTILNLKSLSKKDFDDQQTTMHAPFGELLLLNAEDIEKVQNIFEELRNVGKKSAQDADLQRVSQGATYGIIFACIPFT